MLQTQQNNTINYLTARGWKVLHREGNSVLLQYKDKQHEIYFEEGKNLFTDSETKFVPFYLCNGEGEEIKLEIKDYEKAISIYQRGVSLMAIPSRLKG